MATRDEAPASNRADPKLQPADPSRRDFLARATRFTLVATSLGLCGVGARLALPTSSGTGPSRVRLGSPGDFRQRSITWLKGLHLFVLRKEQGLAVLSDRCTHLGCTVRRSEEGFACPCHGARFGSMGEVVTGPARRPLPWYFVSADEAGDLWADTDRQVPQGTWTVASTWALTDAGGKA